MRTIEEYSPSHRKLHDFMAHYLNNPDWGAIALDSSQFKTSYEAKLYSAACEELVEIHGPGGEQIKLRTQP